MIGKAMILPACIAGFVACSFPCVAQTFGNLVVGREAPGARGSLLADPSIARWIMTLPAADDAPQADAASSITTALFDASAIGGEIYHFGAMPQAAASEGTAEPSLADEAFNANPIGGETFELMKFSSAPFRTMAQNAGLYGKPALEGRSASIRKGSHRAAGRAGATAGRTVQICRCVLAGRSSAKSPGRLGRRPALSHTTSI